MNLRKPQWTPEEVAVLNQRLLDAEAAVKRLDTELTERDRDRERLTAERDEARSRARQTLEFVTEQTERSLQSQRQAAAMRDALLSCYEHGTPGEEANLYCPKCGYGHGHEAGCKVGQALALNAGHNFVPRTELEASQRREAAMRQAVIKSCRCDNIEYGHYLTCPVISLTPDAGKDFVPRSELDAAKIRIAALEDSLREIRMIGDNDWERSEQIARACLDGAAPTAYVPLADVEPLLELAENTSFQADNPGKAMEYNIILSAKATLTIQTWYAKHPKKS